jgi:hypothetical protein
MWKVWVLEPHDFIPQSLNPICNFSNTTCSNVVGLFSENYKYALKYLDCMIENHLNFWEIEKTFLDSCHRELDQCSNVYIKRIVIYLQQLIQQYWQDIVLKNELINILNFCVSKINSQH